MCDECMCEVGADRDLARYIIFELLRNVGLVSAIRPSVCGTHVLVQSLRATRLTHQDAPTLPPIRATISAGENMVAIRISDQGQPSHPENPHLILSSY